MSGLYEVSVLIPTLKVENTRNIVIRRASCPYPTSKNNALQRPNLLASAAVTQQPSGVPPVGCMGLGETSSLVQSTTGLNTVIDPKRGFSPAVRYKGGWLYWKRLVSPLESCAAIEHVAESPCNDGIGAAK